MVPGEIELIDSDESFARLEPHIMRGGAVAIDIETSNWWNRDEERISIIQIGFRDSDLIRVAICDPQAALNPERLRGLLELGMQTKVMHNASYDAVRIERHYGIRTSPVHDTMLAARRAGEKGCSLKALAARHLGLTVDKTEQRSDWSRRPLTPEQLRYAALDVILTLQLYELQAARGLAGDYQLRTVRTQAPVIRTTTDNDSTLEMVGHSPSVSPLAVAIIQIVIRFPRRYGVRQLVTSISDDRSGIAGWIADQSLSAGTPIDSQTVTREIESLLRAELIRLDQNGRLEVDSSASNRLANLIPPGPREKLN